MPTSQSSLRIGAIGMLFALIASLPVDVSAATTYNNASCNGAGIVLNLPKNALGDYVAKKGTTFTGNYYGKNTGTTTWTRYNYFPYHPEYGISWISPNTPPVLPSSVYPGSTVVVPFTATALDVGRAEFKLQMYQKYVSNFGAICTIMVQVDANSPVADLQILKTGPATISAGTLITYKLAVKNVGPARADTIVVRDIIPAGLTYNEAASETPCNQVGTNVECPLSYLGAGQTRTFTLKFDVAQNACGTTIVNRSSVTTVSNDTNSANNQSVARTTVSACPAR